MTRRRDTRGWYVHWIATLDAETKTRFNLERGRMSPFREKDDRICDYTGQPVTECVCGRCDERE